MRMEISTVTLSSYKFHFFFVMQFNNVERESEREKIDKQKIEGELNWEIYRKCETV